MIIGSGLIANSLKSIDSQDHLFFASGVSNSLETRNSEFEREFSLLKTMIEENKERKLVYFSTLSIHDQSKQNSPYVLHKKTLEDYIKNTCDHFLILRIGNIVGKGGNPNTLFNFLTAQISGNSEFTLHLKARRLLLDIADISKFLGSHCLDMENKTLNLAFPYYYDLKEIINAIEEKTRMKACFSEVEEGDFYKVGFDESIETFFSGIQPEDYLKTLTQKYI
ncbi:hypothetical protein SAMN05421594_2892 [Chryseobacterium oleae]|uniref:NAD dependent epimerase/dehydratase family protein n=1 Tax=Chryseobacterium oleae TaxID=491207 RepID=A0A1I4ZCK9_CHROL|nr:NAD(P)-dependent oxidoreductase [Chryseobacterium oleae]SFN48004.1 hypothetical protein SAMN05421594_2892 [Chryseobacterium oleae]